MLRIILDHFYSADCGDPTRSAVWNSPAVWTSTPEAGVNLREQANALGGTKSRWFFAVKTETRLRETGHKAFLIADNRLTENSSWDERLRGEQLKVLSERELDFDLEITGFEMAEIDVLIDGLETLNEPDPDDRLPAIETSAVIADAIKDSTARGALILDPFLGSGTAVIAAERTGRVCLLESGDRW